MIEDKPDFALVYGRRFEAGVPLTPGADVVAATVSMVLAPTCRSPAAGTGSGLA